MPNFGNLETIEKFTRLGLNAINNVFFYSEK